MLDRLGTKTREWPRTYEARNAEYGRQLISASRGGQSAEIGAPAMKTVLADGRIVAIGMSACLAIAGAADAAATAYALEVLEK